MYHQRAAVFATKSMSSKVDSHFEDYREQTRIKHEMLTKYLKPYFGIRAKGDYINLLYIDAFAGRGTYDSSSGPQLGSRLRALATFETMKIKDKIGTLFIESDDDFFKNVDAEVTKYDAKSRGMRTPTVVHGTFEVEVEKLLDGLKQRGKTLAPSFLFADPCGVEGLRYSTLHRYLTEAEGEALLFFNYDGVTRIAGLGFKQGKTLSQLFGSDERAQALVARLEGQSPGAREDIIIDAYKDALREDVPKLFCTAFRVEHEDKRKTSHYLIHLSRHPLGFALMKDIMWPLGETDEGKGALELEQASISGSEPMFRPAWDDVKESVLQELRASRGGRLQAKYFYETLSEQPDNALCRSAYRMALFELEAEGKIVVLDKNGAPTTAKTRRPHKGKPTLSKDCVIALK
jgi:three-Cys-motif partner protein